MKFQVAKSDLEAALSVARLAVASGDDLSSHYLFRIRDGGIEVLSYDLRIFARAPVAGAQVDGDDGEAFTVQAKRLDKWMAGATDSKPLSLTISGKGEVALKDGRSRIRIQSLDPTKFPYWDELLSLAKDVGDVAPQSLSRALDCSRWFVSADDNSKPELCQVEALEGVLWATDRRALSSVEMPKLPNLSIRVPGKNVPALTRFLADKTTMENEVTISEAERAFEEGGGACAVFKRPDGAYLGVTRPTSNFPTLTVDREAPDGSTVQISREEFNRAIAVLLAGAPNGHDTVTFRYNAEKQSVSLVMPCVAGGEDEYALESAECEICKGEDESQDGSWTEFTIDYTYINGIANTFSLDTLTLGVNRRERGGFVTFRHSDEGEDGNSYFSVIVWRT
jgi:hypothetical protein